LDRFLWEEQDHFVEHG
jgi:hypothetical protein